MSKFVSMGHEIALLKSRTLTEQINLGVTPEVKARFRRLKDVHGIDVNEESRKMLADLLVRLEKTVPREKL